ncbi:hypothetical protein FBU59_003857, partial [Linderina macrospora]
RTLTLLIAAYPNCTVHELAVAVDSCIDELVLPSKGKAVVVVPSGDLSPPVSAPVPGMAPVYQSAQGSRSQQTVVLAMPPRGSTTFANRRGRPTPAAAAVARFTAFRTAYSIRALTSSTTNDKTIELAHQRQQAQDDAHSEAVDEGDRTGDSVSSSIERLDPRSIPGLYPELTDDPENLDDSWYVDPQYVHTPLWQRNQRRATKIDPKEFASGSLFELCKLVLEQDAGVAEIDVSGRCEWTQRFLVVEAKGARHMHAMAEDLVKAIKERNRAKGVEAAINVDGRDSDDWVVVDLGSFVVHLMTPEARKLYDLEGLWSESSGKEEADEGTTEK